MKTINRLLCLFILFCFSNGTAQNPAREQMILNQWIGEIPPHTGIGVYLQDARTGNVLASNNPQLSLVPASTLKLLTTATALEVLGPYYTFETKLAYSGEIRNDSLLGNLIITGGGDPALGSTYFRKNYLEPHFLDKWVVSMQNLNIRHIAGDIMTDATIYEEQTIPNTWIWEDMGNYYGAGASGLSVYDNLYEIHLFSPAEEGKPTRITGTVPVIPGLKFENQVLSSNIQRDQAYVFGSPIDEKRIMRGTIPKNRADFVIKASIPNPPYLLGSQLKDKLEAKGVVVDGQVKAKKHDEETLLPTVLATTVSPPLIEIIGVTNHESVNLFAEHLLKQLALYNTGWGTTEAGTAFIAGFWKEKGLDTAGLFLADGSGLSRFNAVSPKFMVDLLYYMKHKSLYGEQFFSTLPGAPNGTLWYFRAENFPNNSLRAKSGSMTRVRCFAGTLKTQSGQEILFSVFMNNFSGSAANATRKIEDLLVKLSVM
ncbi:D-alanyl-D-alanine carboxypeptidase/D-alanyl-D-alanine endopeptidase [Gaoshiqia sp. Z1-71]|uniref:D-alanyl-D-alanine carboxypeptidase/D-alanyl-D-alanine endopeptidase n=1 Tax=Gaoshiqia hydrogeniformans TaxID=3290090 RepID=UPI003BF85B34